MEMLMNNVQKITNTEPKSKSLEIYAGITRRQLLKAGVLGSLFAFALRFVPTEIWPSSIKANPLYIPCQNCQGGECDCACVISGESFCNIDLACEAEWGECHTEEPPVLRTSEDYFQHYFVFWNGEPEGIRLCCHYLCYDYYDVHCNGPCPGCGA
jgi:hypothetical protein